MERRLYNTFFLSIFLPTSSILPEGMETLRIALPTLGPSPLCTLGSCVPSTTGFPIKISLGEDLSLSGKSVELRYRWWLRSEWSPGQYSKPKECISSCRTVFCFPLRRIRKLYGRSSKGKVLISPPELSGCLILLLKHQLLLPSIFAL